MAGTPAARRTRATPTVAAMSRHAPLGHGQQGFSRKSHLAIAIDIDAFYLDGIPDFEDAFHPIDALVGQFRYMHQPIGAGKDFDKGAEIGYSANGAGVFPADFRLLDNRQHSIAGGQARVGVDRRNQDRAVVVNINLSSGFLNDGANDFASGADDVADLSRIDLDGDDAWGVRGDID